MVVSNSVMDAEPYHQLRFRYQHMAYAEGHLLETVVAVAGIGMAEQHLAVLIGAAEVVLAPLSSAETIACGLDVCRSSKGKRTAAVEHWDLRLENSTPLRQLRASSGYLASSHNSVKTP